jgi:hypothetical protein
VGGWFWDLANARGGPPIFLAAPRPFYLSVFVKGPLKKTPKKAPKKESGEKRPTDLFSFFQVPLLSDIRVGCRLWTCHRRLTPAAGCGVFFYELVPSGYPFICSVFAKLFFVFFSFNGFFVISSEKKIKFATRSPTF